MTIYDERNQPVNAHIVDTETGIIKETKDDKRFSKCDDLYWTSGNGSCDCNRAILFGNGEDGHECLGSKRYVIIKVEPNDNGCSLNEYNEYYPTKLLRTWLIDKSMEKIIKDKANQ